MTTLSEAYRRGTDVNVVVSGARGPSDFSLWRQQTGLDGTYQDYLNYLADVVIANEPGFKGDKGDPGADLGEIGTFADLQDLDVLAAQPGATIVRLTDRPGPWRRQQVGMPALNPAYENVTWTYDGSGATQWFYSPQEAYVVTGLGVDATGALDATGRLVAAAGRNIKGGGGVYKAGPITLKTQEEWDGENAKVNVVPDGTVFLVADGVHDWRISNWQLVGTLVTATDPDDEDETGIQVRDATRGIISNVSFTNFKKVGLHRNAATFTDDGGLGRGARTLGVNLAFYACAIGLKTEAAGGNEYDIFSNVHAGGCLTGADLNAGNTILNGFHLVDNRLNLRLRGGNNNHLHNIIGDGTINHLAPGSTSTYLLHATDIRNGVSIGNVAAYANGPSGNGPVFLEQCGGVNWTGGILDCWTYVDNTAFNRAGIFPYNRQENLFMPGGYGPARIFGRRPGGGGIFDDYSPDLIRKGCYGPGVIDQLGVTTNDPYDVFVLGEQNGATVPFATNTIVKFPEINRIGDRRKCYDPATGLVTIPKWMTGLYEYEANFVVSGTLANPEAAYFEVVVFLGGIGAAQVISPFLKPDPHEAGLVRWQVKTGRIVIHLTEGDTIGLRASNVPGANPGLGENGWRSQFTLRKLA